MKYYYDIEQGSPAWFELRRGVLTASLASNLLTPTGRPSSAEKTILARLLAERLGLQDLPDLFQTDWMTRGIETEEEALNWLEFETSYELSRPGFVMADGGLVGCSPDAVAAGIGPVEVKVPKPSTHILWLTDGTVPKEHVAQVHFQMCVMNTDDAIFMSYCPPLKPLIVEVEADDYTDKMANAIESYSHTFQEMYNQLAGEMQ